MFSRKKRSAKSMSEGQEDGTSQNGRRSASAAFGDDNDDSMESPLRKKQNTSATPHKPTPGRNKKIARTSDNEIQTSNGHARDAGVVRVNGSTTTRYDDSPRPPVEKKDENVIDVVPPTSVEPTKAVAVARTPKIKVAEKTVQIKTTVPTPQNTTCDVDKETQVNADSNAGDSPSENADIQNGSARSWSGALGWFGFFVFVNLFVLLGVIWTGMILNESIAYQLDSLECRERLDQTYKAMGLNVDLDDDDDEIRERFEEQRYYWQELESQVRYWKKEAKKYQQYGDGYKNQCQTDLKELLSEIDSNRDVNQGAS